MIISVYLVLPLLVECFRCCRWGVGWGGVQVLRMMNWMVSSSAFSSSISWPRRLMSLLMSSSAAGSSAVTLTVWPGFMLSSSRRTLNTGSGQ